MLIVLSLIFYFFQSLLSISFGYSFDIPQKGQNSIVGSVAFSVSLSIRI